MQDDIPGVKDDVSLSPILTQPVLDGSSNKKGNRAGIILEGPEGFRASNNQVEYETLLVGIQLAKELGVWKLAVKSDSQLVTGQVNNEYQAKDLQLTRYLGVRGGFHNTVIQEALGRPIIEETWVLCTEWWSSWRDPIISYLSQDMVLDDPKEARRIKREATKYVLIVGQLYRRVDYFTKWIEVKPIATILAKRVKHFYWRRIIYRFRPLAVIVSDNGTQFASRAVAKFCTQYGIRQSFTSVEHPQSNGQVETTNRVILRELHKWLEEAKG
ncbi:Pol polyprotein, partial [Mucuna pruriens]